MSQTAYRTGQKTPPTQPLVSRSVSSSPISPPHTLPTQILPAQILLVEDDPDTARIVSKLIENLGYRVHLADSMSAACDLAESTAQHAKIELVICDIGLPDGSGFDLMRQLKNRYGLRGICLSGRSLEDDATLARESGFVALLTKPFEMHDLGALIAQIVT
jgi:DNA-binding response OmpR family regulator